MSTLAYDTHDLAHRDLARDLAHDGADKAPRRALWRRFVDAMIESRRRQAEREIGYYIATHGGRLTDQIERDIAFGNTKTNRRWMY
ncbi:MAG: hypothetical protein AB7K67_18710 [Hyphomicrobiaceae bacterium]